MNGTVELRTSNLFWAAVTAVVACGIALMAWGAVDRGLVVLGVAALLGAYQAGARLQVTVTDDWILFDQHLYHIHTAHRELPRAAARWYVRRELGRAVPARRIVVQSALDEGTVSALEWSASGFRKVEELLRDSGIARAEGPWWEELEEALSDAGSSPDVRAVEDDPASPPPS